MPIEALPHRGLIANGNCKSPLEIAFFASEIFINVFGVFKPILVKNFDVSHLSKAISITFCSDTITFAPFFPITF